MAYTIQEKPDVIQEALDKLGDKLYGNPITNREEGYDAGIMASIYVLEELTDSIIGVPDMKDILETAYKEASDTIDDEFKGSRIQTDYPSAFAKIASVYKQKILEKIEQTAKHKEA